MNQNMEWRVLGQSVRGAAHERSGLPNQDAIHWLPASGIGPPLIMGVADGHGSPKSFRSDIGSRLAVGQSVWLVQDLLDGQPDPANLSAVKRTAEEYLPREIVRRWQQEVMEHLGENPFMPQELALVAERQGKDARTAVEKNPLLAYGATILIVLVTRDFLLYFQLGDGDILVVSDDGHVDRPLPKDERLFANETTSLCSSEAWRDVRFRFQAIYNTPPALILLSTDGYANSYRDDADFLKIGHDMLSIIRQDGVKTISNNLETWLHETTAAGSGDDITLGMLYRTDLVKALVDQDEGITASTHAVDRHKHPDAVSVPTSPQKKPEKDEEEWAALKRMKQDGPRELSKKIPDDAS